MPQDQPVGPHAGGWGEVLADDARVVAFVGGVEAGDAVEKSTILAQRSYVANYLAKMFGCDITTLPNMEKDKITVVVGRDFSQRYNL